MAVRIFAVAASFAVAVAVTGCSNGSDEPSTQASGSEPAFSYDGATGPEYWAGLNPEWEACDAGSAQSPIDLGGAKPADLPAVTLAYATSDVEAVDLGTTVDLEVAAKSTMTVDGTTYELVQIHFHSPSEHAVDGLEYPAEFHFVHQAPDGTKAVVGVLVTEGEPSALWQPMIDAIAEAKPEGDPDTVQVDGVDLTELLAPLGSTTRYMGSLTTPPCTEGVQWIVRNAPLVLSAAQIAVLADRHSGDSDRPVQPAGDRQVLTEQ